MNISRRHSTNTIIAIYLLGVALSIFLAFDFTGRINFSWLLPLIVLTLPWSIVSILFLWALIHGAGLEFFTGMYLIFAILNSWIFFWFRMRRGRSQTI